MSFSGSTLSASTTDIANAGTYVIKVYGELDNTPLSKGSATFNVVVNDGCNLDVVSLTTSVGA